MSGQLYVDRLWTATDNCGNTATGQQTISVGDNTPPVFTVTPSDLTVECSAVPPVANVTATDNCDVNVTVTYNEVKTNGTCTDSYVLTRTWVAIDNCDNANTHVQKVTVRDTTKPVLVGVPADVTAECGAINIPTVPTVTATDNCDLSVTVSFVETTIDGGCPDSYSIIRRWTATDNCGNSTSAEQTISVGDNTPPEFTNVPNNVTVECDAIPGAGTIVATDNCDNAVAVSYNEVITPGTCENQYTITRTGSLLTIAIMQIRRFKRSRFAIRSHQYWSVFPAMSLLIVDRIMYRQLQ
ncbi:MAG: hypothetical protein IPJ06_05335 [Saprospiraceae bacterium]|nr:hypothetical protein [Saprospiraceae bacterium]